MIVSTDGAAVDGIVSERDVVRHLLDSDDILDGAVSAIMTVEVATAAPDTSLDEMRALMTERRIRHVPVVKDGRLTGIISIGDVVKAAMDQLQFERDQLDTTCTRPDPEWFRGSSLALFAPQPPNGHGA